MAQIREFLLPDVGEGLTEAEVLTWHVAVGDHVTVNQPLVEIETAKAAVELPSPFAGVVTALHVESGAVVPVGTPIIAIATGSTETADAGAATPETKREAVLVGYGVAPSSATRRPRRAPAPDLTDDLVPQLPVEEEPVTIDSSVALRRGGYEVGAAIRDRVARTGSPTVRAKPPVRKRAKELGVDLASVTPTGADGVITRADVEGAAALAGPAEGSTSAGVADGVREERIPVRGVLKSMADAMVRSA